MIFIIITFIFFAVFFTFKKFNNFSVRFLYGLIFGSAMSYIAFILYLSKFNFHYNTISQFFNFNPGTWNYLVLQNFNPDTLIRLLNGGTALFHYSFLCFSLSFSYTQKKNKQLIRLYIGLMIIACLQFLFFDPAVNIFFQNYSIKHEMIHLYHIYSRIGTLIFQFMNFSFLIIAIFLLIRYYIRFFHIRFLKNYTFFTLLNLFLLGFAYKVMFYWAPTILVRATFSVTFKNYLQPQLTVYFNNIYILPIVIMFALGLMIFNVYKYKTIENHHQKFNILTQRDIDTASLGVRVFTHSIKNHLLAIRSEAEFLKENLSDNEEVMYSLDLIINSSNQSFDSLDSAEMRLKHITLTLEPKDIHLPIKHALERINLKSSDIKLTYEPLHKSLVALIDHKNLQEVIYNLVQNAIEALPDGKGTINIDVKKVNQWGAITVKDSGIGIKTENLDEVFNPFYSTKSSISNWGIGLSYCYKIVKGHKGKIEVNNLREGGTQFDVLIPLIKQE